MRFYTAASHFVQKIAYGPLVVGVLVDQWLERWVFRKVVVWVLVGIGMGRGSGLRGFLALDRMYF
jgi:hypothetical protein